MATEVKDKAVSTVYGEQLALTNTAASVLVPGPDIYGNPVTAAVLYCGASDFRYQLCPRILAVLKSADAGATFTDYTAAASDKSAATVVTLSSINTLAEGDFLLVGSEYPFAGLQIDVSAANGTASVMTVHYVNTTAEWADISATDGTDSGGATLGADGKITWTVPTAWAKATYNGKNLYWVRLTFSAALDSSTTLSSMSILSAESNRGYAYSGFAIRVPLSTMQTGAIEAVLASGTATLDITWIHGNMVGY